MKARPMSSVSQEIKSKNLKQKKWYDTVALKSYIIGVGDPDESRIGDHDGSQIGDPDWSWWVAEWSVHGMSSSDKSVEEI